MGAAGPTPGCTPGGRACVCVCVCRGQRPHPWMRPWRGGVCVCVCVCRGQRAPPLDTPLEGGGGVCVCVCVCVCRGAAGSTSGCAPGMKVVAIAAQRPGDLHYKAPTAARLCVRGAGATLMGPTPHGICLPCKHQAPSRIPVTHC